jgi:hypothetical protein
MLLIRIWTKTKGVVYEWGRGGVSPGLSYRGAGVSATTPVTPRVAVSLPPVYRQLALPI